MNIKKTIAHFNRLNGKQITKETLIGKLDAIAANKNIAKTKPGKRMVAILKNLIAKMPATGPARVYFDKVKYQDPTTLSGDTPVPTDPAPPAMLYGLECLTEDPEPQTLEGTENVYDFITKMIVDAIKKEGLIWRKGWNAQSSPGGAAKNFVSKKPYKGFNSFLLNLYARLVHNKKHPYWLTFKQVEKLGGQIKKGTKSSIVVYYKMLYRHIETGVELKESEIENLKPDEYHSYPMLRYYHVYNGDDITGIDWKLKKPKPLTTKEKIASAEAIVKGMPLAPPIRHGGDRAFYTPNLDAIQMPAMEAFDKEQEYYGTLFHEMVHSTGHKKRVGRSMKGKFGSKDYAFEELIAEIGASFLNGEAGTLYFTMDNSAAYIKGWKKTLVGAMQDDNKFIFNASAQAQKAADFILDKNGRNKAKQPAKKPTKKKNGFVPNKAVKANIKLAVRDVLTFPTFKDVKIGQGPGEWLYNMWKANPNKKIEFDDIGSAIGEKFAEKLEFVLLDYDDSASHEQYYYLNDLGKEFVAAVAGRLSSRKQVKQGSDLFPEVGEFINGLNGGTSGLFTRADKAPDKAPDTFRLNGPVGKFLGEMQRYKLAIALHGDYHGGKSEFAKQLVDAFADHGFTTGLFDLEQGGLTSKDTIASIERNIKKANRAKVAVAAEAPNGIDTIKEFANRFDVVVIDSWQKLQLITNERFDELRKEFPKTIWIIIFQQNAEGEVRGGVAANFDAPIALKAIRADYFNFDKNYIEIKKNRGNPTDLWYMIAAKKVVTENPALKTDLQT